jgi:hypothetical protein
MAYVTAIAIRSTPTENAFVGLKRDETVGTFLYMAGSFSMAVVHDSQVINACRAKLAVSLYQ